jgi:hypothetical protein
MQHTAAAVEVEAGPPETERAVKRITRYRSHYVLGQLALRAQLGATTIGLGLPLAPSTAEYLVELPAESAAVLKVWEALRAVR